MIHQGKLGDGNAPVVLYLDTANWKEQKGKKYVVKGVIKNLSKQKNIQETGTVKQTVQAIIKSPWKYYANVHTDMHAMGAVAGQVKVNQG